MPDAMEVVLSKSDLRKKIWGSWMVRYQIWPIWFKPSVEPDKSPRPKITRDLVLLGMNDSYVCIIIEFGWVWANSELKWRFAVFKSYDTFDEFDKFWRCVTFRKLTWSKFDLESFSIDHVASQRAADQFKRGLKKFGPQAKKLDIRM